MIWKCHDLHNFLNDPLKESRFRLGSQHGPADPFKRPHEVAKQCSKLKCDGTTRTMLSRPSWLNLTTWMKGLIRSLRSWLPFSHPRTDHLKHLSRHKNRHDASTYRRLQMLAIKVPSFLQVPIPSKVAIKAGGTNSADGAAPTCIASSK